MFCVHTYVCTLDCLSFTCSLIKSTNKNRFSTPRRISAAKSESRLLSDISVLPAFAHRGSGSRGHPPRTAPPHPRIAWHPSGSGRSGPLRTRRQRRRDRRPYSWGLSVHWAAGDPADRECRGAPHRAAGQCPGRPSDPHRRRSRSDSPDPPVVA